MNKPLILLSNDDGVHAPGLFILAKTLHTLANLVIVAPEQDQSGSGVSITWNHPLEVKAIQWKDLSVPTWSVSGTPADCIKMALHAILPRSPDLIISGINAGSNAGRNVLHSGTIGAVIEGVMRSIPGIAFSCQNSENPLFDIATPSIPSIVLYVLQNKLPEGTFFNINYPNQPCKGVRFAIQGKGRWLEDPLPHIQTDSYSSFWISGKQHQIEDASNSDVFLLSQGYATITPISIRDLTDIQYLQNPPTFTHEMFTPF